MNDESSDYEASTRVELESLRQRIMQSTNEELLLLAHTLDCLDNLMDSLDIRYKYKAMTKESYKKKKAAIKSVMGLCENNVQTLRKRFM